MKRIFFTYILTLCTLFSYAQSGTSDPTFADNGSYVTDEAGYTPYGFDVFNDKIYIVGTENSDVYVTRLTADGIVDTSFSSPNGYGQIDVSLGGFDVAYGVKVQSDGKVIIVGTYSANSNTYSFITRLTEEGYSDQTFAGGAGTVSFQLDNENTRMTMVDIDALGRIVVAGTYKSGNDMRWVLARFTSDGAFDNTFSGDGKQSFTMIANGRPEYITRMEILNDNSIVILGGNDEALADKGIVAKIKNDGNLETSFADQGKFIYNPSAGNNIRGFHGLDIMSDGGVWFCGIQGSDSYIVKLTPTGTYDSTFHSDGIYTAPGNGFSSISHFSDRILTTYIDNSEVGTARFMVNGNLDFSYGNQGIGMAEINQDAEAPDILNVHFQSSGNLLVFGNYSIAAIVFYKYMIRILNPGFSSVSEYEKGIDFSVYPNPTSEYFMINEVSGNKINTVELLDMSGRTLQAWTGNQIRYNIPNNLASGIYFVQIRTSTGISRTKLMIGK